MATYDYYGSSELRCAISRKCTMDFKDLEQQECQMSYNKFLYDCSC